MWLNRPIECTTQSPRTPLTSQDPQDVPLFAPVSYIVESSDTSQANLNMIGPQIQLFHSALSNVVQTQFNIRLTPYTSLSKMDASTDSSQRLFVGTIPTPLPSKEGLLIVFQQAYTGAQAPILGKYESNVIHAPYSHVTGSKVSAVVHQVGHFFGLVHNATCSSKLYPTVKGELFYIPEKGCETYTDPITTMDKSSLLHSGSYGFNAAEKLTARKTWYSLDTTKSKDSSWGEIPEDSPGGGSTVAGWITGIVIAIVVIIGLVWLMHVRKRNAEAQVTYTNQQFKKAVDTFATKERSIAQSHAKELQQRQRDANNLQRKLDMEAAEKKRVEQALKETEEDRMKELETHTLIHDDLLERNKQLSKIVNRNPSKKSHELQTKILTALNQNTLRTLDAEDARHEELHRKNLQTISKLTEKNNELRQDIDTLSAYQQDIVNMQLQAAHDDDDDDNWSD